MRIIIAGSRTINDYDLVCKAMEDAILAGFVPTEIVSGHANGVDKLGERWGKEHGIDVTVMPANWDLYGRGAGMIRNKAMAEYASKDPDGGACVIVWDGISRGTANMAKSAIKANLTVLQSVIKSGV